MPSFVKKNIPFSAGNCEFQFSCHRIIGYMKESLAYSRGFWQRVLDLLSVNNLSKADLSRMTGISTGAISSAIRRGNIPVSDNAVKIAQALGTTVEYLVTGMDRSGFGEFVGEPDLNAAFQMIQKGKYKSMIAQSLPYLNLEQQQALLAVIKAMGIPVHDQE